MEVMMGCLETYFDPILELVPSPMPIGAMREILRHEGAGMPCIVVADKVDGGSELGSAALYVEHDDNANPVLSSKQGAIGADVDPLTPMGALYGAQVVYQQAREDFSDDLRKLKMNVPRNDRVLVWIMLMHAKHSLGRADFRVLLRRGAKLGMKDPLAVIRHFAFDAMPPRLNRQKPELVRKRLLAMLELPKIAAKNHPLPDRIGPLPPRPVGTPVFDGPKAKRYILAERKRMSKRPIPRRRPDGSPPM